MTALDPRGGVLAAAVALCFGGGLSACTAAPRFPVIEGEAPGGGLEPMQARYPTKLAEAPAAPATPDETAVPPPAPTPRESAPRAAPAGAVSSADLPPPPGAAIRSLVPPSAEALTTPPPIGTDSAEAVPTPPPPAGIGPPTAEAAGPPRPALAREGFIQRDGSGPGRFTIGAPVPPPSVVAPPGPTAPRVYARPSAPSPIDARPNLPPAAASATSAATHAAVAAASASPNGLPGGPKPYGALFPSGPAAPRAFRSAGIRSTPSNPGIAPQALSLAPEGAAPSATVGDAAARGRGRFRWPLLGALLSGFGDKGGGVRNDGVNIAANLGDPVKASAAGEVVYAGNQVPGSGNLVLVKHPGGWVTEYAHLSRIEVRNRDPVVQGQELGQAGQTGAVDRPQLHFEIRYAPSPEVKAVPVDPAALLPAAG